MPLATDATYDRVLEYDGHDSESLAGRGIALQSLGLKVDEYKSIMVMHYQSAIEMIKTGNFLTKFGRGREGTIFYNKAKEMEERFV